MRFPPLLQRLARAALLAFAIAAAPGPSLGQTDADAADPIEPFNRYVFEVNRFADEFFGKPVAVIYRGIVPSPARDAVANALANLKLPWTAVNDLLQGEIGRASEATARFVVNSTFGILGLFDAATPLGIANHEEDFGQTLGVWGLGGDPYLVLPVFGPSNPRDTVGLVADRLFDPVTLALNGGELNASNGFLTARGVLGFVSARERAIEAVDEFQRGADYYAAIRSAYRQRRAAAIRNDSTSGAPQRFRFGSESE